MDAWKIWKNGDRDEGRRPLGKGTVKDGSQTPAKGREKGDRREDRPLGKGIRGGSGGKEDGWQLGKGGKPDPAWVQDINVGVPFEDGSPIQGSDSRDPRWQSRFNPWDGSWLPSQGRVPLVGADNWALAAPAGDNWVANGPTTDERWHGRARQWQGWQEDDRWQGSSRQQQVWEDDKWWDKSWDASRWQHSDSPPSNWKEERSMLEERLRKAEAHGKSLEAALAAMKGIGKGAEITNDRHDDDNGRGWHFPGNGGHNNSDNTHHEFGRNMLPQNFGANQMPVGSATPRVQRATPAVHRTSGRSLPPPRRQDAPASPDNAADLWASYRPSTSSLVPIGAAGPALGAPLPSQAPSCWLDREVQVDERGIAPWQPPLLQNVQVATHAPAQGRLWAGPSGSGALASNGSPFPGQGYSAPYVRTPRGDVQDPAQQIQMARHNSRQFDRNSSAAGGGSCGSLWLEGAPSSAGGNSTKGGKGARGPRHHSKGPRDNYWWQPDQAGGKDGPRYREPGGGGRDGYRVQKVTAVLSRGASLGSAPRARPKSSAAGHAAAALRAADMAQASITAAGATAPPTTEVNESVAQASEGGGDAVEQPGSCQLNAVEVAVEEPAETTSAANASAVEAALAEGKVGTVETEEEEHAAVSNESVDADVEILWPLAAEEEAKNEASADNEILWPLAAEDNTKNEASADNEILWPLAAEDKPNNDASADNEILWPLAAEDEAGDQAGADNQTACPLTDEDEAKKQASADDEADDVKHSITKEEEKEAKKYEEDEEEEEVVASVTYQ